MYRLALELLVSIAIVAAIMFLAATLIGHPAYGQTAPAGGCAVRSPWTLGYIVIGTAWAAASLGFLGSALFHSGSR